MAARGQLARQRTGYVGEATGSYGAPFVITDGDLYVLPVSDRTALGAPEKLLEGSSLSGQPEGGTAIGRPTWSPDSRMIAFFHCTHTTSNEGGTSAIYAISREGGPPVVDHPGPGNVGNYLFCFWNVENLFDDRDDHRGRIDEEYDNAFARDDGLRKLKYDRISEAILKLTGGTGPGPDVIACAEVESTRAATLLMEALNARIGDPARRYSAVGMKDLSAGRHIAPCLITRVGLDLREVVGATE